MSGLIGGAGSKSGVIGATELDYKTGTWVPTQGTFSLSSAQGTYTKIGTLVNVMGYAYFNSTANSDAAWGGLPFKSASDAFYKSGGNATWTGMNINAGTTVYMRVKNSSTTWTFYCGKDEAGWNDTLSSVNNNQIMFYGQYHSAS